MTPAGRGGEPHVLPHPVRCEDCENSIARLGRCRLAPLSGCPEVKPQGCLYYQERGDDK